LSDNDNRNLKGRLKILAIFSTIVFGASIISAQRINKNDFYEADMALVSSDYERAQKIFERLVNASPDNASLNFLNGLCLINLPGRKKESLKFLEIAAPKASPDYVYGDPEEANAPLEALKYYGIALKLNDDIPKAIELLNQYKLTLKEKEKKEIALTLDLIQSCYTTLNLKENPVYYRKTELGDYMKSTELRLYPVVNKDETMLFYTVKGQYNKDDIFFSKKKDGEWDIPVKITTQLGVRDECYPSSVSSDNERLYLTVNSGMSTDIYYSVFTKDKWQRVVKLEKPVNGNDWDSQASESPDGKYLYFSSDRKGGLGNMDLYRSEKGEKGEWKKPVNLGPVINSAQNELMPVVSADGTKLFFKSEAHQNAGGYDIFVSQQTGENVWGQPVNIGYPINTTDDDIHFYPARDGNFAYVAQVDALDKNKSDIYLIEIFSESHPRKFDISGLVILPEGEAGVENTTIEVFNTKNYEKVFTAQPPNYSGNYSFEVPSGAYMINYVRPNYKTYTQLIDLPMNYTEDALTINAVMEKEAPVAEVIPPPVVEPVVEEKAPEVEAKIEPEQDVVVIEPKINQKPEPVISEPVIVESRPEPEKVPEPVLAETSTEPTSYPSYAGKYTIQFMASLKMVDLAQIGGRYQVEIQKGADGYYRYISGVFNSPQEAEQVCNDIKNIKYRNAFIREYNLDDYLHDAARSTSILYTIQLMAIKKETDISNFKGLTNVKANLGDDRIYRYTTGEFRTLPAAQQELKKLFGKGYSTAFIKKISEVSNYH
jgi:hypothetical protein